MDFNHLETQSAARFYCEYKTWERIHHSIADLWLLANPASWSRVADFNPNLGHFYNDLLHLSVLRRVVVRHCITCVAQGIKGTCWPGVILAFLPRFYSPIKIWLMRKIEGSLAWHLKQATRVAFVTPLKGTIQTTNWRRPCITCQLVLRGPWFLRAFTLISNLGKVLRLPSN